MAKSKLPEWVMSYARKDTHGAYPGIFEKLEICDQWAPYAQVVNNLATYAITPATGMHLYAILPRIYQPLIVRMRKQIKNGLKAKIVPCKNVTGQLLMTIAANIEGEPVVSIAVVFDVSHEGKIVGIVRHFENNF